MLQSPKVFNGVPVVYSRYWMTHFLPETMINAMMRFAEEMNELPLSPTEMALFKAIVILCPGVFDIRVGTA